ncbi:MAG TPA: histidine phosphatase family protein [Thermoplasmata archaeon]|nr:histidine phosphatase family protein [Thermoplasmata archaeon]
MEVYLVRHGPAATRDPARWPDDRRRPLTAAGAREAREAARGFATLAEGVDRIATSPYERTRATAEILRACLGGTGRPTAWEELSSGAPSPPILERLARRPSGAGAIVLVGHEPTLGEFLGCALTGEAVPIARLTKSGAASLSFPRRVAPGAGKLDWLLTRKQLIALAP